MFKLLVILPIFLINLISQTESGRILALVPSPSYSHQVFFRPLWKELANRGHEIVLLTTNPMKDPALRNIREIDLSNSSAIWLDNVHLLTEPTYNFGKIVKLMFHMIEELIRSEMGHPEVKQLIQDQNEHFDLLMVETFSGVQLAFKHRFQCPAIGISSMELLSIMHEVMGNPTHSVLYPNVMLPFEKDLTFLQRVVALIVDNLTNLFFGPIMSSMQNQMVEEFFGSGYPDVEELLESMDMLFQNTNPLSSAVRPFVTATVSLSGGFHETPLKPLPKDLQSFMDKATEGVIYFSFGSNVKSIDLSSETLLTIMETFKELPYKILWKFENDALPDKPENVKIPKWLPQQDILRHKNLKLFITQGGIQSVEESIHAQKPMVVLPRMLDQDYNAVKVSEKGLGLKLDISNLNVENFKKSILEVIKNPKYKENVGKHLKLLLDQPMQPLQKAVWWTEYA